MLFNVIHPTRERPDTNVFTEFTAAELDAVAPLRQGDEKWLGEFCYTTPELIERMDERIKAAKRLKYGGCA